MATFDRLYTSSYLSFIVHVSLSTVTQILGLSVEYWRDLEIWVRSRGRSKSLKWCRSIDDAQLYIGLLM